MGRGDGVRAASASSIVIDFRYKGERCREPLKLQPTKANLAYARNYRGQILREIALGSFDYAKHFPDSPRARKVGGELVSDYLERWLESEKDHIKASTARDYGKTVRLLTKALEGVSMLSLTLDHIKPLAQDRNPKRLANILSPLRIALDDAVSKGLLPANPMDGWKLRRRKVARPVEVDPFDSDERRAIIETAREHFPEFRPYVQFDFWTGLRTSEMTGLMKADRMGDAVRITRALTAAAKEPEEPKTAAGTRIITLLPPALEALEAQAGYSEGSEYFFLNPRTQRSWSGDKMIREHYWRPLLEKAGVRYRYPYQMRHTFASMMLQAGEHPMWVARMMGHRDWGFTVRTYSRFIPSDMPEAGQKALAKWTL